MGKMLILAVMAMVPAVSSGYTVDGYLDDWGIDLSASGADSMYYLDAHLPSGGLDIDYVTEDNTDKYKGWVKVGPLYSWRNYFDVEAIYFDNDALYVYIAVVTGLPQGGYWGYAPGDIAIDADYDPNTGEYGYEYGIDISEGELKYVEDWQEVHYAQARSSNPYRIGSGSTLTSVDIFYGGEQKGHYVLEAKVPLSALGLVPSDTLRVHWTMECGNDYLTLDADVNPTPEPATLLLLGSGLLGLGGYAGARRKKKR